MLRTATPNGLGLGSAWASSGTAGQAGRARSTAAKRRSRSSCPATAFSARKTHRASRAAIACPSGSSAAGPSPRGNAVSQILWVVPRVGVSGRSIGPDAPIEPDRRSGRAKSARTTGSSSRLRLQLRRCPSRRRSARGVAVDGQEQAPLRPGGDQRVEVGAGGQVVSPAHRSRARRPRNTGGAAGALGQAWRSSPTLRHAWLGASPARSTRRASVPAGPPSRPGVTTASTAPGAAA